MRRASAVAICRHRSIGGAKGAPREARCFEAQPSNNGFGKLVVVPEIRHLGGAIKSNQEVAYLYGSL